MNLGRFGLPLIPPPNAQQAFGLPLIPPPQINQPHINDTQPTSVPSMPSSPRRLMRSTPSMPSLPRREFIRRSIADPEVLRRIDQFIANPDFITDADIKYIVLNIFANPGTLVNGSREQILAAADIPITKYSRMTDIEIRTLATPFVKQLSNDTSRDYRVFLIRSIKESEAKSQIENVGLVDGAINIRSILTSISENLSANGQLMGQQFVSRTEFEPLYASDLEGETPYDLNIRDNMDPNEGIVIDSVKPIYDGLMTSRKTSVETFHEIMGGEQGSFFCHFLFPLLDGDNWREKLTSLVDMCEINMKLPHNVMIDILFYEYLLRTISDNDPSYYAVSTYKMSIEGMRRYLTTIGYGGSTDDTNVFMAYCTGFYTGVKLYPAMTEYLKNKPPFGVVLAASCCGIKLPRSPYHLLASQFESPASLTKALRLCLNIKGFDHLAQVMKKIGMVPPPNVVPFIYFIENISLYEGVFNRQANMGYLDFNTPLSNILFYTDKEILNSLEPDIWTGRESDAISSIREETRPGWSFRHNKGNNLRGISVIGDTFVDELREEPEQTVVSYGTNKNYRVFSLQTLIDSIQDTEVDNQQVRAMVVPGYLPENRRDNDYPNDVLSDTKVFSDEDLLDLYIMLKAIPQQSRRADVTALLDQLVEEIRSISESSESLRRLMNAYKGLDQTRKNLFRWFVYWFIVFSIWVRKWKGPGNSYPHDWTDDGTRSPLLENPDIRDNNVAISIEKYYILKKMLTREPDPSITPVVINATFGDLVVAGQSLDNEIENQKLNAILDSIRFVEFNFNTDLQYKITTGDESNVKNMLTIFLSGRKCAGLVGDLISKSSIFYAWKILGDNIESIPSNIQRAIIRLYSDTANVNNTEPYDLRRVKLSGHLHHTVMTETANNVIRDEPSEKDVKKAKTYFGSISYFRS